MISKELRLARVFAMQLLYCVEISGHQMGDCVEIVLNSFREANKKDLKPELKNYGMSLVDLVQEHRAELDQTIQEFSIGWDLNRIAILDRIVLEIALAELQYKPDVPVKVVLAEAVQIAKKYSTDDSFRFVNGMLNQCARKKGMILSDQAENSK